MTTDKANHPLERVLIAVDETKASAAAVEEGVKLAGAERAKVIFVHIVPPPVEDWLMEARELERISELEGKAVLQEALYRAESAGVEAVAEQIVAVSPGRELARAAKDYDVDLIVVGARDRCLLTRTLFGRTSRRVLRRTRRPTLVVRAERTPRDRAVRPS